MMVDDYSIGYDRTPSQRLTQLSVTDPESGDWVFLDPTSLEWITLNSRASYYRVTMDIGLVKENKTDPAFYTKLVLKNEYLVQFPSESGDVNLYSSVESLKLLNEIFGDI